MIPQDSHWKHTASVWLVRHRHARRSFRYLRRLRAVEDPAQECAPNSFVGAHAASAYRLTVSGGAAFPQGDDLLPQLRRRDVVRVDGFAATTPAAVKTSGETFCATAVLRIRVNILVYQGFSAYRPIMRSFLSLQVGLWGRSRKDCAGRLGGLLSDSWRTCLPASPQFTGLWGGDAVSVERCGSCSEARIGDGDAPKLWNRRRP